MRLARSSLFLGALAAGLAACYSRTPLTTHQLTAMPDTEVFATLLDGTEVTFSWVRVEEKELHGHVVDCDGRGCAAVRSRQSVLLSDLSRVQGKTLNKGTTILAAVAGVAAAAATVTGIYFAVKAASWSGGGSGGLGGSWGNMKMSCPHVYSFDGHAWRLDSDTYGMGISAGAQETDHDLLEYLRPVDGRYLLRLANELDEVEHTDALVLRVVDHPAGSRVVPSHTGALHTFVAPRPPLAATDLRGADALERVARRDGRYWASDVTGRRPERADDARDGLLLEFARPAGAKVAKLWLSGMNTRWASVTLGYVLSQMGSKLDRFYARLDRDPEAQRRFFEFAQREGMLQVDVWTGSSWSRRGLFWAAGPDARKDQALTLAIGDLPGERLRVRLESAVAFWTIDSVVVDYGPDLPLRVQELRPSLAVGHDGRDLRATLAAVDGERYSTVQGQRAELAFDAPPAPPRGEDRSYVLESTGYYRVNIRPDPQGQPAAMERMMATPGAASRVSLALLNNALGRSAR